MSEFEQPLKKNESLQVSEQILESAPAHLSETQQGTLSEGPLQQEDPFEAELLQVKTDYQEVCRKMADTVKPERVKEEEKALALFLGQYCRAGEAGKDHRALCREQGRAYEDACVSRGSGAGK